MLKQTELTERVVMLRERLGHGAAEVVLLGEDDGDEYGGRLEEDDYQAGAAALAAMRAKKKKTPEDKEAIKKACDALSAIRRRARQRVEAEKTERRVELLEDLVEKLEVLAVLAEKLSAEECYLMDLLSVI